MSDLADRETRGQRAQSLVDHPAFAEALDAVRERIHSQFATAMRVEDAWDARQRLRALDDVRGYLQAAIADGKAAQAVEAPRSPAEAILSGESEPVPSDYLTRAAEARAAFDPQPEGEDDGGSDVG